MVKSKRALGHVFRLLETKGDVAHLLPLIYYVVLWYLWYTLHFVGTVLKLLVPTSILTPKLKASPFKKLTKVLE